ncbi:hypothetical protein F5884DRAFT_824644 [Xylogone sp. PMI_703]|nr:hypothetical protein F5884DRAFT_824644 [Xylogone sp. PMI_703]
MLKLTARRTLGSSRICLFCRQTRNASISARAAAEARKAVVNLSKSSPARTRFAPSPTGYLHLGSLRTALFNYLVAKKTGGQFLLRIEDTDQKRTVSGAEDRLFIDLQWAGIHWDEGPLVGGPYGPYRQSERTSIYQEHAQKLLESGHAYRCFCSAERLHTLAEHRSKQGLAPEYDRKCAHIPKEESNDRASNGESHVIRLKVPEQYPQFNDLVYGIVRQKPALKFAKTPGGSYDDPILLKSDGFPTYHLANVVDDHLMQITHVIRGAEWMPSTPKHLAMYDAFGWTAPQFAHVGLLVNHKNQKLSKRDGSIDISSYREQGIFPEVLTNFVALLGWSHSEKTDVMDLQELIEKATMKYTRGDTRVSFEKLWYLQKMHAQRYAVKAQEDKPNNASHDLMELVVKPILQILDHDPSLETQKSGLEKRFPDRTTREQYVYSVLLGDVHNYKTPSDFVTRNKYFFSPPSSDVLNSGIPKLPQSASDPKQLSLLAIKYIHDSLAEIGATDWEESKLKPAILEIAQHGFPKHDTIHTPEETGTYNKKWMILVHQYLRWALLGGMPGPDTGTILKVLGRDETFVRLDEAILALER